MKCVSSAYSKSITITAEITMPIALPTCSGHSGCLSLETATLRLDELLEFFRFALEIGNHFDQLGCDT